MNKTYGYIEIYSDIIDLLSNGALSSEELVEHIVKEAQNAKNQTRTDTADDSAVGIRAKILAMLTQMLNKKIIARTSDGRYYSKTEAPIALRAEKCEDEILKLLIKKPLSRDEIRKRLANFFGTPKTKTKRDDNMLNVFISDTLKRLVSEKTISYDGTTYFIPKGKQALVGDKQKISEIKADFLSLLHARGGQFFEHYFMNLLARYLKSIGKIVKLCEVTGGASDGGIDGIAITEDQLGFIETIMVQTKNRTDYSTELDIRGFYGAVNAQKGTRGIFATTSGFHHMAKKLLDELDDCVGIDGEKIFDMARKVGYGIISDGESLKIDTSLI